jgi:hypothetical protein
MNEQMNEIKKQMNKWINESMNKWRELINE